MPGDDVLNGLTGIGDYEYENRYEPEKHSITAVYRVKKNEKAFLVTHLNPMTVEVRTDRQLAETLIEKYESVMKSRYFGKNGIEIIPVGQLSGDEIDDLVRLSYNLSAEEE